MDDILAKKNRHLFLEEKDNQNNSFIGNINDVANRKTELDTVAAHIENVDTVGDHIDNVDTVANNISDINDAVDNIATVKTFNDNVNNGTMQYLLEAFTTSLNEQGNAWEIRLTQLGESILATTSAFNYSTVVTVSNDIPANGTLILPNAMKYKVGTHMLMVSWNGTVCYAGDQYDEVGAYGVWATSIKLNQPAKAGDKIQLRIVALTDQSSYVDITEAAINASQFVASGSNTERYLPEFLGDVVNVKNFGAVGNGVNDDTTAFQSAIASGKAVFVPEGTYKLNTDLNGVFCGIGNSTFIGGTINGSTILRGIAQKNSDIINVKDFGAIGDGSTDDTVAVQTALNTSACSVFFPAGKYKITETLNISVAGKILFGPAWPRDTEAPGTDNRGAVLMFYIPGENAIGINSSGGNLVVEDLGFNGSNSTVSSFTGIKITNTNHTADTDPFIKRCTFFSMCFGVECWGRAPTFIENFFVGVIQCIRLEWPDESTYTPIWYTQEHPYANRAVRIINNRKHGGSSSGSVDPCLIYNAGYTLRSALIFGNYCDIGDSLYKGSKGLDSCLISNNICDLRSSHVIHETGPVYNTIITNNNFSYQYSKIPNNLESNNGLIIVLFEGVVDCLVISNNVFQGAKRRCIQFGGSTGTDILNKDINIVDNIFDMSFPDSTAYGVATVAIQENIKNLTYTGNIITGSKKGNGIVRAIWQYTPNACTIDGLLFVNNILNYAEPGLDGSYLTNVKALQSDKNVSFFQNHDEGAFNINNIYTNNGTCLQLKSLNYPYTDIKHVTSNDTMRLRCYGKSSNSTPSVSYFSNSQVSPLLGTSDHRWEQLFANTATISTSDARLKVEVDDVDEKLMRAWGSIDFKSFMMKDSYDKKGKEARIHVGVIAQEIDAAFAKEGLDASRYGFFCYDKWDDEYENIVIPGVEEYDENEKLVNYLPEKVEKKLIKKAGDQYSIRYEEALALECAYQRWLGEQRDAKIEALMQRISALENNR